ncbi:hypothetical protein NLG97_g4933 [Lecanicillium saksenae]|uniref:Uncharacterized protein n=1 Tax=Lecanicillium saksenae TaxID=468837 RepID=A0ACC1QVR2_9HYPO|nr:hypothetical protein NLG97_g4933 [Lecanicillium saksenae]
MSGFELAGIVLGTIPLLISALEHYHDGMFTIRRWRQYQRERQNLVRILKVDQVRLRNVCAKLLRGAVPAHLMEHMIRHPFGREWDDAKVHTILRARLHDSIDLFQETIDEICGAMLELARRLRISPLDLGRVEDESRIRSELRRAVFAIGRRTYDDITSSIDEDMSRLEALVNGNISLEPERKQQSEIQLLTLLQELSFGLHRAVDRSLSCMCPHALNLRLKVYPSEVMYSGSESEKLRSLDFHVLLSRPGQAPDIMETSKHNSEWRGLQFYPLPVQQVNGCPVLQSETLSSSEQIPYCISDAQTGITTSFKPELSHTTETLRRTVVPNIVSKNHMFPDVVCRGGGIYNLCAIAVTPTKLPVKAYGFVADVAPSLNPNKGSGLPGRRYEVYPVVNSRCAPATVSLREVLDASDDIPNIGKRSMITRMTLPEKIRLAVTISSSFLQLHKTPWLPDSFSSADIIFLRLGNRCEFGNVFLWKNMTSKEPASLSELASIVTMRRIPALLSLGFLLVEIFFGRPIGEGGGTAKQFLERQFREAQSLLPVIRRESANYFSAVSRCLDGELHWGVFSEEDMREKMYSGIVSLLKKDLESL